MCFYGEHLQNIKGARAVCLHMSVAIHSPPVLQKMKTFLPLGQRIGRKSWERVGLTLNEDEVKCLRAESRIVTTFVHQPEIMDEQ